MNRNPLDDDVEAAMDRARPAIDSVLSRYRARRTLDRDDAEEIASEVQVTLLTRLRQAGAAGIDAFEAYAVGVTRNLVRMLFRQRRRRHAEALAPLLEDEWLADMRPLGQTAVEQRYDLERMWRKIEGMPQPHRAALLLGMRTDDGEDGASLLIFLDVTSMDDLAAAIGVTGIELEGSLWDELPLDDVRIAQRLDVTPRKVISLRRSSRRSLTALFRR